MVPSPDSLVEPRLRHPRRPPVPTLEEAGRRRTGLVWLRHMRLPQKAFVLPKGRSEFM